MTKSFRDSSLVPPNRAFQLGYQVSGPKVEEEISKFY